MGCSMKDLIPLCYFLETLDFGGVVSNAKRSDMGIGIELEPWTRDQATTSGKSWAESDVHNFVGLFFFCLFIFVLLFAFKQETTDIQHPIWFNARVNRRKASVGEAQVPWLFPLTLSGLGPSACTLQLTGLACSIAFP